MKQIIIFLLFPCFCSAQGVKVTGNSGAMVYTISGSMVNNTDPMNPIINSDTSKASNTALALKQTKNSSFVYLTDYGGIADSSGSNYAAFVAAEAALPTQGGVIYVSAGKYRLDTMVTFTKTVSLRGAGAGISTINTTNLIYATCIFCPGNSGFKFTRAASSVNDFTMRCTDTTTADANVAEAIRFQYARYARINNVILHSFAVGINIRAGGYWNVTNSVFTCRKYDMYVQDSVNADEGDAYIAGNTFFATSANFIAGVWAESAAGTKFIGNKWDFSASSSTASVCFYGNYSTGGTITSVLVFNGNSLENYRWRGIYIKGSNARFIGKISITGNEFSTNNSGTCDVYATTTGAMNGLAVTGNNHRGGNTADTAIYVSAGVTAVAIANSYDNFTIPVLLASGVTNTLFDNCHTASTTLVSGTKAITITGLTTSSTAWVQLTSPSGTTLTTSYKAVCTSNTLTITANVAAGTINSADGSTLTYFTAN